VRAIIRPHLQSLLATDRPHLAGEVELAGPVLLLNARTVPSIAVQRQLEGLIDAGKPGMVSSGNAIAACLLADGGALPMSFQRLVDHLETLRLDELAFAAVCAVVFLRVIKLFERTRR